MFVGFSDITLLHIAIQQQTGLITFHGPNLQDGFGKPDDMPAANEAALWRAVLAADEQQAGASTAHGGYTFDFGGVDNVDLQPICAGVATGRLIGGNLAVLCGVMGTPFEIETAGRILFLEDISERLYRIDRYLSQLKLAGKLRRSPAFCLAAFRTKKARRQTNRATFARCSTNTWSRLACRSSPAFRRDTSDTIWHCRWARIVEVDADQVE